VLDVQADEQGRVWHVLETQLDPGQGVNAEVSWERRFDFMQQHTGQHVLSAAFERIAGAATLSSRLGAERSTIEIALADAAWQQVREVETAANRVLWEDRPVECHWVEEADLGRFDLRKPPPRDRAGSAGRIRIVRIPEWDVSACGGTHTRRTGEVGVVKILRWEKVRGNLRFEFVCGGRALEDHAWRAEAMVEAARRHTLKDRDLLAHLERALGERDDLRKRLQDLSERLLVAEARERTGDPPRPVGDFAESRERAQVRLFVIKCLEAGAPWAVAGAAGPEPTVVAARARHLAFDLKALVPGVLERSRGRGGGSPGLVTVTAADGASARAAYDWLMGELEAREGA
jgi:alanyl-tRNA synthetase